MTRGNIGQQGSLVSVLSDVHLRAAAAAKTSSGRLPPQYRMPESPHGSDAAVAFKKHQQTPRNQLSVRAVMAGCAQMRQSNQIKVSSVHPKIRSLRGVTVRRAGDFSCKRALMRRI
jgi:hypothetical protein